MNGSLIVSEKLKTENIKIIVLLLKTTMLFKELNPTEMLSSHLTFQILDPIHTMSLILTVMAGGHHL